ncbi:MAG: alginate lyase family protein [Rhodospirillales bacterium]|nr:alginate lyase family protein [Rhodospirillales bacterium]
MSISHLFRYGLSLPLHVALAKAMAMARNRIKGKWQARTNRYKSTYVDPVPVSRESLCQLLHDFSPSHSHQQLTLLHELSERTLAHRFNLLGSGWTDLNRRQTPSVDISTTANAARARDIRAQITPPYQAIDWHTDFRSGYRWSAIQPSPSVLYGHEPDVDIKVPWELARMQHLAQLALACAHPPPDAAADQQLCTTEFQNQLLDFMAANPPAYGVNWVCTMDVAIRAANLILAYDLLRAQDISIEPAFINEFVAAIRAHGVHIVNHLEWHRGFRGNHYLADITGLLFVAGFLPRDPEIDCWLAFAVQQFVREVEIQFHGDGANAEASTGYHRLSAEMAVYGTALILGLSPAKRAALQEYDANNWSGRPALEPGPVAWSKQFGPFAEVHFDRLRRMAQFTVDVTKPDGHVVQIGDTDNGRLFKLSPVVLPGSVEEDHLQHGHLVAAIGGLLDDRKLLDLSDPAFTGETEIIRALKGPWKLRGNREALPSSFVPPSDPLVAGPVTASQRLNIELPSTELLTGLRAIAYPEFGLFIWRAERFFMAVRCGPVGQGGNGGHAHNDQLAFELQIDGEDWIADPGTYTYTADPKRRDQYRSHLAHAGPRLQKAEPSRLNLGLFRLEDNAQAQCRVFHATEFLGLHRGYGTPTYRQIKLGPATIQITDSQGGWPCPADTMDQTTVRTARELRDHFAPSVSFSRGYGIRD